jgi:hypothetical protein
MLSYGDKPPLVIVLIYIEAYGISIFNPATLFEAAVFGSMIPITRIRRGSASKIGEIKAPVEIKGIGGSILINDRIFRIPVNMREINEIHPNMLR